MLYNLCKYKLFKTQILEYVNLNIKNFGYE